MKATIERMAALAMKLGEKHLANYGAVRSRHDFTQRQLMACLILRAYLKTTYRGLVDVLAGHGGLRRALGMADKVPHYTTLQKFSTRSQVLAIADLMLGQIGRAALRAAPKSSRGTAVAIDATGLDTTQASAYFMSRAGRTHRKWLKVSVSVVCGSLLPLGLVLDWGPNNDKCQAAELLTKSQMAAGPERPQRLYADAGYDADWIHRQCRDTWGVESLIPPARHRADGTLGGTYRAAMTADLLRRRGYGRRWAIESFFSGLKRMTGSALTARRESQQIKEAAIRVVAYALFR